MNFLLDTNIFNWLIDGRIGKAQLPAGGKLFVTHLQIDEMNRTSDEDRRARLTLTLATTIDDVVPTESTIIGVSRLDYCKLGDGAICESVRTALDGRNGNRRSNVQDALIAEVAILTRHTLVTADGDLADVAREHGCDVLQFSG